MITIHQRHRQTDRQTNGRTDRQTTCDRNTALCTKVHRAVTKALNINSCHSPMKFSQPANLTIYTIWSLFSLQVEPARHLYLMRLLDSGLEVSGGGEGGWIPQFMSTDAHFWVKIGFKFQSLGKISNIATANPPVLLGQFQHWLDSKHCTPRSCKF